MNLKNIILIILQLFILSCNHADLKNSNLIIIDSIETEYKSSQRTLLNTLKTSDYGSDSLLTIYSQNSKSLSIYSLNAKKILDYIEFKKQINCNHSSVYINPTGKVFILHSEDNILTSQMLHDSVILQKLLFPNLKDSFIVDNLGMVLRISKDSIFTLNRVPKLYNPVANKENYNKYFSLQMNRSYKILKDSIHELNSFGEFPKEYLKQFYFTFRPVSFLYENDSIISYVFPKTDFIYSVNIKSGKLVNCIKVNNGGFNWEPITTTNTIDMSQTNIYEFENRSSLILFNDKVSKCYLLVVKEPFNFENKDKSLNEWEDAQFNIYKVNKEGEIIDKFKIPDFIDPRLCIMFNDEIIMYSKHSKTVKLYITKLP